MKFSAVASVAVVAFSGTAVAFAPTAPVTGRQVGIKTPRQHLPLYEGNLDDHEMAKEKKFHNPTPVLWSALTEKASSVSFVSTALAALLSFTLLTASPDPALAARSGGRIGGSFGSSAPAMRSAPSRSSYGGGGGGYYRGGGYRGGVTVAPIITPYYSPPVFSPFYGGYGAMAVPRGPSFFDLLFFGSLGFVLLNAFTNTARGIATSGTELFTDSTTSVLGSGTTVAKISVALEVPNRDDGNSILSSLERLAQTAKTDSRVGIQNLTSQVALELLRRKSSIVSAFSQSQHFRDKTQAQREYSLTAVQERGKFEEETISQFGGVDYGMTTNRASGDSTGKATMAVVTFVFAIDGDSTKLPKIRSIADVEEALRRIATDSKVDECLQSTEILWTPEDRSETLSLRDVIADYPELVSV